MIVSRRIPVILVVGGLVVCGNARADVPRVRVSLISAPDSTTARRLDLLSVDPGARIVATLDHVAPDTLVVRRGREILAIPRDLVSRLEISRGRHSKTGTGALIGMATAGAGGAIVGAIVFPKEFNNTTEEGLDTIFTVGLAVGCAIAGTGLGALIGSQIRTDDWQPWPFPRRSLGLVVRDRGVGFALRLDALHQRDGKEEP